MGQIPTTPAIIPVPFAANGQKNSIPETVDTPGAPNASWSAGFPSITMINRQAGGKPPLGMDFNGVLNQLSSNAFFAQSGGLYPWDAALDYLANAHVQGSDGEEYIAVAPSGPDVPAAGSGFVGAQDPTEDTANAYWISASAKFGAPVATQSVRGIARLATTLEVQNGQSSPDAPAPAVLRPEDIAAFPTALGGVMMYNVRTVLTTSGSFTASVTGWHRITLIAGGGAGGHSGLSSSNLGGAGGTQGGDTVWGDHSATGGSGGGGGGMRGGAGGGGAAGEVVVFYAWLIAGQSYSYTVGAGAVRNTAAVSSGYQGGDGSGPYAGKGGNYVYNGGTGAAGAGNGEFIDSGGAIGGSGGLNGTGFGGGGGGGCFCHGVSTGAINGGSAADGAEYGQSAASGTVYGYGGAGGNGAVIIEYFDPIAAAA